MLLPTPVRPRLGLLFAPASALFLLPLLSFLLVTRFVSLPILLLAPFPFLLRLTRVFLRPVPVLPGHLSPLSLLILVTLLTAASLACDVRHPGSPFLLLLPDAAPIFTALLTGCRLAICLGLHITPPALVVTIIALGCSATSCATTTAPPFSCSTQQAEPFPPLLLLPASTGVPPMPLLLRSRNWKLYCSCVCSHLASQYAAAYEWC
mmetsp:Transcript_36275/g.80746  ORF Transcript_36275/g.80746 Transcript_36275/m.80746 type:complete len:207 (-) Transcript_36275:898-1518(-)